MLRVDDALVDSPNCVASIFNNYYSTITDVLLGESNVNVNRLSSSRTRVRESFFFTPTDEDEIIATLSSLSNKKSVGFDGVPLSILALCPDNVFFALAAAIHRSFEIGLFPDCLKLATVIPIFKQGNRQECHNYRPISMLTTF